MGGCRFLVSFRLLWLSRCTGLACGVSSGTNSLRIKETKQGLASVPSKSGEMSIKLPWQSSSTKRGSLVYEPSVSQRALFMLTCLLAFMLAWQKKRQIKGGRAKKRAFSALFMNSSRPKLGAPPKRLSHLSPQTCSKLTAYCEKSVADIARRT